jgi:hypothetical protein
MDPFATRPQTSITPHLPLRKNLSFPSKMAIMMVPLEILQIIFDLFQADSTLQQLFSLRRVNSEFQLYQFDPSLGIGVDFSQGFSPTSFSKLFCTEGASMRLSAAKRDQLLRSIAFPRSCDCDISSPR